MGGDVLVWVCSLAQRTGEDGLKEGSPTRVSGAGKRQRQGERENPKHCQHRT